MTPNRVIGSRSSSARQRLPVALEQLVEQSATGGIGKRLEHQFHGGKL